MQAQARQAAAPAFALAMFMSAALIFALQPMFSRLTTPLLGGSPAVWNTSMAFFQAALLAGYLYAHLLQRLRDLRLQAIIHTIVLASAFIVLPIHVSGALGPPDATRPVIWLLGVLTVSVGLPFAAASATSPLLQAWYTRTGRADAGDPYYLYAASNLGSLLGLLLYPVLIEPLIGTHEQSLYWAYSYGAAACAIALCGAIAVAAHGEAPKPLEQTPAPTWRQRLYWLAAAALPTSAMLGVTQHISTDVASAPFLWVLPLALYLIAFIIAFIRGADRLTPVVLIFHPLALSLLALLFFANTQWLIALGANLLAFFLSALICALALARTRPAADRATEFYLWVSLGGVIGGAATALLAPIVFPGVYEYPLALAAIALFRPAMQPFWPRLAGVAAAGAGAMAVVACVLMFKPPAAVALFAGGVGAAAALMAGAIPKEDPRPLIHRIAYMVASLAFAGLMTLATINPDLIAAQTIVEGQIRFDLKEPIRYLIMASAFLTLAFVVHAALQPEETPQPWVRAALGAAAALITLVLCLTFFERGLTAAWIVKFGMGVTAVALIANWFSPRVMALLILALFAAIFFDDARGSSIVAQHRSFFGVLRVEEYGGGGDPEMPALRILKHGTTIHGAQLSGRDLSRRPLTYYHPETALGEATLAGLSGGEASRLALVGLGTGTTACLMRPRDELTIFEIDPAVIRMSGPSGSAFTYVGQCQPNARIELGDARLRLAEEPDGLYDVIVVDAFSSDAIPAHLLTREAVAMYMRKLSPRGIVVLHLSNRNLALVSEAARVANALGLPYLWRVSDRVTDAVSGPFSGLPASAMILARNDAVIRALPLQSSDWAQIEAPKGRPWTDDYINLPRALYESLQGRD
ncbi:MAG: spermidine synthase [Hyphomonadaceae bacterium]